MKQLQIQIPDKFAGVLTVTCVKSVGRTTNVTVEAFNITDAKDDTILRVKGDGRDNNG
jgi:hypothetical protein